MSGDALGAIGQATKNIITVVIVVMIASFLLRDSSTALASTLKSMVGFGDPQVTSFTVNIETDESFKVAYKVSEDFDKIRSIVVKRYYRKLPTEKLGEPLEVSRLSLTSNVQGTLKEKNTNGLIEKSIPIVDEGKKIPRKSGVHTFTLEMVGLDGELLDDARTEIMIYDESFLETFDTRLETCKIDKVSYTGDLQMKYCNVVACKNADFQYISKDTTGSCFAPMVETLKQLETVRTGCAKVKETPASGRVGAYASVDLSNCKDNLADFNRESVKVWMMYFACVNSPSDSKVLSPDDLPKLDAAKLNEIKTQAITRATACVDGLDYTTGGRYPTKEHVDGLRANLDKFGFLPVGKFERRALVETELNTMFDDIKPGITSLGVDFSSDKKATVKWEVVGKKKITVFTMMHCWTKYARDKQYVTDATGTRNGGELEECEQIPVSKDSNDVVIDGSKIKYGMHTFTLVTNGVSKTIKEVFYDKNYLETYSGTYGFPEKNNKKKQSVITICVEKPSATKDDHCDNDANPSNGNIAECNNDCNIMEKKRLIFAPRYGNFGSFSLQKVYDNIYTPWKKSKSTSCQYLKDKWTLDGCSAEEVDELYKLLLDYVFGSNGQAYYDCSKKVTENDDYAGRLKDVCAAKEKLEQNLKMVVS